MRTHGGIPVRVAIAGFTSLICLICLVVFWVVIFQVASTLARQQGRQVRRAHLQLVKEVVQRYFAEGPAFAKQVQYEIHQRHETLQYAHLLELAPGHLRQVASYEGIHAVGMGFHTEEYSDPKNSSKRWDPPCNTDDIVVRMQPVPGWAYQNRTLPTTRLVDVAGPWNRSANILDSVDAEIDFGMCEFHSWSVLLTRFRRYTDRSDWGSLRKWGGLFIAPGNVPLTSFTAEFTNKNGSQHGFIWVDTSMRQEEVAPMLTSLPGEDELLFLIDNNFIILAASAGKVFADDANPVWRSATDSGTHPWISKVATALLRNYDTKKADIQTLPESIRVGELVADTLVLDDGYELTIAAVAVGREKTILRDLYKARSFTLGLGAALLVCSTGAAVVLAWLATRHLAQLVIVLECVADMQLDEVDEKQLQKRGVSLHEVRVLQEALFVAITRLREYKAYMPSAIFAGGENPEDDETGDKDEGAEENDGLEDPASPTTSASPRSTTPLNQPAFVKPSNNPNNQKQHRHRRNKADADSRSVSSASSESSRNRQRHHLGLSLGLATRPSSVMVCDVSQFHDLPSRFSTVELVELHGAYVSSVLGSVHRTRGLADGFAGDHIIASWNTQIPLSSHRRAACECALELAENLPKIATPQSTEIVVRVAVCSGRVFFGNMGCHERRAFCLVGPLLAEVHEISKRLKDVVATPPIPTAAATAAHQSAPSSKPNHPNLHAPLDTSAPSGGGVVTGNPAHLAPVAPLPCIPSTAAADGTLNAGGTLAVATAVAGSTCHEQRGFFHFIPLDVFRRSATGHTSVLYGVQRHHGEAGEWMYELSEMEKTHKPELWTFLTQLETSPAAAARTFPLVANHLPAAFRTRVQAFLSGATLAEQLDETSSVRSVT